VRRLALLLIVAFALPLRALPWDYHAVFRQGLARVPRSEIVEVGYLDGYDVNPPPMTFFLSEEMHKPFTSDQSVRSLPWCPGHASAGGAAGYRLVVGPELHEVDRGAFVLARACRRMIDGRVQARVRETFIYLRESDDDRWEVRGAEQHREREATSPMLLTRSVTADVWQLAFIVMTGAALVALVVLRRRFGTLTWREALVGPDDPYNDPQLPASDGRVLPLIGGWGVAMTIGCVWLMLAAIASPQDWKSAMAILGVAQVLGGAWLLSTLHWLALWKLPVRGPIISATLGACAGWIAAMLSDSIPGMTQSGAVIGGVIYGVLVGVTNLARAPEGAPAGRTDVSDRPTSWAQH
jgi:hypothetical protein